MIPGLTSTDRPTRCRSLQRNRYYGAEFGRFVSSDPIEYGGGDLNLYCYLSSEPLYATDPTGNNAWDLGKKLLGLSVPKAIGVTAGGILQFNPPVLIKIPAVGAEAGLLFFADTCEIGLFSLQAGIVQALDPNGGPPVIDFEAGLLASLGVAVEVAELIGPGPASAGSFAGRFYTFHFGMGPASTAAYVGEESAEGKWIGGAGGLGGSPPVPPIQIGFVVWNYQLIQSINLSDYVGGYCLCLALIKQMPSRGPTRMFFLDP
jgi:RHS repeat-associated protein